MAVSRRGSNSTSQVSSPRREMRGNIAADARWTPLCGGARRPEPGDELPVQPVEGSIRHHDDDIAVTPLVDDGVDDGIHTADVTGTAAASADVLHQFFNR